MHHELKKYVKATLVCEAVNDGGVIQIGEQKVDLMPELETCVIFQLKAPADLKEGDLVTMTVNIEYWTRGTV